MVRWLIVCGLALTLFAVPAAAAPAEQTAPTAVCEEKSAHAAGSTGETLVSGGLERVYRLYVPESYDPTRPTPLVFNLHGAVSSADEQEAKTPWNDIAARENFIMAYPQGIIPLAFGWAWNAGEPLVGEQRRMADDIDDVQFIADLIAHLSDVLCIDAQRVYVSGFSNGGGMSNHLACVMADTIAAIGTVAGAYTPITDGCHPVRPVPIITFQGKLDNIVPYDGSVRLGVQDVTSWAADWAARNGCEAAPTPIERAQEDAVSGVAYTDCAAPVVFYTIADGGHTWPGGRWKLEFILGKTSTDIDASETMWAFFAEYPKPLSE